MSLSPPATPPPFSASPTNNNNHLSDIFSDSPPSSPAKAHPSDISRLRATHSTAGYRAGITTSKEQSLQPGFDEGYSLGAVFGLRVGYILGALEGLCTAHPHESAERKELAQLMKAAREQLTIEKIFGREWWGEDGIWRYEVQGTEEEVTFHKVVDAHPLVKSWAERVETEMSTAGIKLGRFLGDEWEQGRQGGDPEKDPP